MEQHTLVVDLDGTLLRTDTLHEGVAVVLKKGIFSFFTGKFPKNRLELKFFLLQFSLKELDNLPVNLPVLNYLQKEKACGANIVLATASPEEIAKLCVAPLGVVDAIFASTRERNLKGQAKADVLCQEFGAGNFDYMGNSLDDIPVWACCRKAIVVSNDSKVIEAAKKVNPDVQVIALQGPTLKEYLRLLRVHQWIKNLLIFLPMLLAHAFTWAVFLKSLLAFVSLCFCASAIYIVNDVLDLSSDRKHPRKKSRPLASGAIPLAHAPGLFSLCVLLALVPATFLPAAFLFTLLAYFTLSLGYSLLFKKWLFLDVIVLSSLYVIRIVAGAAAIGYESSNWLLGFASFFFLGLALFKRYGGARMHGPEENVPGRAYIGGDLAAIEMMAICSGFCSVVIVALYIDSLQAVQLYSHPDFLWFACPLLIYWYGRLTILVGRGSVNDDPVSFAARDKVTYLVVGCLMAVLYLAL